jgi:hypothetical protein
MLPVGFKLKWSFSHFRENMSECSYFRENSGNINDVVCLGIINNFLKNLIQNVLRKVKFAVKISDFAFSQRTFPENENIFAKM